MVRQNGISATRPVFPSYLLPTFKIPFIARRRSSASFLSSPSVNQPSAATTPSSSPPENTLHDKIPRRISKLAPDTLRCLACSSDIAFASQIISKGFTGRHGRAFLVAPAPTPATKAGGWEAEQNQSLLNIRVGRSENRQLVTGWHVVADISCNTCSTKLGWKYVDAKEETQKYKIGKFILETERVVTFSFWEDCDDLSPSVAITGGGDDGYTDNEDSLEARGSEMDDDIIIFDSDDEEECEDIFAGTWNVETVAKRRGLMIAQVRAGDV